PRRRRASRRARSDSARTVPYRASPRRSLVAVALCIAWWIALFSGPVSDSPVIGVPVILSLYLATLAGCRRLSRDSEVLPTAVLVFCAITALALVFSLWGFLLGKFPSLIVKTYPLIVKRILLFVPSVADAAIVAGFFFYPFTKLF